MVRDGNQSFAQVPRAFTTAVEGGDVDKAYGIWARMMEQSMMSHADEEATRKGRGKVRFEPRKTCPRSCHGHAETLHYHLLVRALNRLQALGCKQSAHDRERTWSNLMGSLHLLSDERRAVAESHGHLSDHSVRQLRLLFVAQAAEEQALQRKQRLQVWKRRMRLSCKARHAWVRGDGRKSTKLLRKEDGSVTAAAHDQLCEVLRAWTPILEKHKGGEPSLQHFLGDYEKFVVKYDQEMEEMK